MKEKQELLMIPGPIEFSPEVLRALARPTQSHVSPEFIECFRNSMFLLKEVFMAPSYQPFILAGSGTMAMDVALSNTMNSGDKVLLVHSGFFSERMVSMIQYYGGEVEVLKGEVGTVPDAKMVAEAMERKDFNLVFVTHVDTSTGVLADIKGIAREAKKRGALVIVDGVAAAGGVECRTEEWGIDIYLTASQKAIGVPPGLALLVVSEEALKKYEKRDNPLRNYYCSFDNWLPIMKAYQEGRPAYFGTPAVNLVYALEVSLKEIINEGLDERFRRHKKQGKAFQTGLKSLGIRIMAKTEDFAAPTLSAIYYPEGTDSALVKALGEEGIIVAGGILPELKDKYFRVGHMGYSSILDFLGVMGALERALKKVGYEGFSPGDGLKAFHEDFLKE